MQNQKPRVLILDEENQGRHTEIAELMRSCEAAFEHAQQFSLESVKKQFEEVISSRACVKLLREEMAALFKFGGRIPPATNGFVFALAESENFVLTLSILSAAASDDDRLYSLPNDALVANLSRAPFPGRLHRLPPGHNNEVYDSEARLILGEDLSLPQNEIHFWDSTTLVPEYVARQDHVVLKLNSKRTQPLLWCYDRATLRPVMAAACVPASSRLQVFSLCLAEMADIQEPRQHRASAQRLQALAGHRLHFVRWTAIQKLFELDPPTAIEALKAAAKQDPHPEVRAAAKKSLDLLAA